LYRRAIVQRKQNRRRVRPPVLRVAEGLEMTPKFPAFKSDLCHEDRFSRSLVSAGNAPNKDERAARAFETAAQCK
jgi:hypothetical protein